MPQLTKNIFEELTEKISGDVYTDTIRRYLHSTDGSIFRVEPACVVYPKNVNDVAFAVKFASRYGLSVHSRGAGSGLCGSAIGKGIVLDFAKYMNDLIEINEEEKTFTCYPGYRFGELEKIIPAKGLFFPPDPSSGEYATFGGMYGTNASGAHSVKYGNVSDYIEDAEIVLSDGSIITMSEIAAKDYSELMPKFQKLYDVYYENSEMIESGYPPVKYNVSGYNLRGLVQDGSLRLGKLFGGSEGTLGVVTKLKFRLLERPTYDSLVVAYFDDIINSAKAVQKVLPSKPAGIEIMDKSLLNLAREFDPKLKDAIPDGMDNVLMIEYDGFDEEEVRLLAEKAMADIQEDNLAVSLNVAATAEEKEGFWAVRKAAVPILYKLKGRKKILALIEDAAVPTDNLVEYFEGLYKILENNKTEFVIYGHIAKGLLHTRPLLDLKDPHDIEMLKILDDQIFELVNSLGGVVSGEHGDGRLRSAYIKKQYGNLYGLFLEAKSLFDSEHIFNPDIKTMSDDSQMKKFLRYGSDYRSDDLEDKRLIWEENFTNETEKCHGCSKCTTVTTATRMCPVYKVTRDEIAAPKAKANILRALLSGAIDDECLYEDAFQEVVEQCIGCGSCNSECPSNVNIPKLAMEAKAQYVKKFGAGIENRMLTSLEGTAKMTRKFSKAIGAPMKYKPARKVLELLAGLSSEREFITFPSSSLFDRMKNHVPKSGELKVLYFSGCYSGYVNPNIGESAVKILEHIGCEVHVPDQSCCGLPHLTKGMEKEGRKKVEANLKKWGKLLREVDYIVVTCSSCGLALSKEWGFMKSGEEVDMVKDKLIHISELVNQRSDKLNIKENIDVKVAYHMPCHLKVQKSAGSSVQMMKSANIQVDNLNSNCCGMGGSWGMKQDHYDKSIAIGTPMTDKLNASEGTCGVTDCPTCTIQMQHMSDKEIKHPVEVLSECLKD